MRKKQWIIPAIAIILLCYIFRTQPLSEKIHLTETDSDLEVCLIRSNPVKQDDGSILYEHLVYEFRETLDSEAGQALLAAMAELPCRARFRFPFENVTVYSTGQDSFSVSFTIDRKPIEFVWLSDSNTMYGLSGSHQTFRLPNDSFDELAAIVEEYGTLRNE